MTALESSMLALCREVAKLQTYGTPSVEFFWDNGMTSAFQVVKVPTLRIGFGDVMVTVDHEGVR